MSEEIKGDNISLDDEFVLSEEVKNLLDKIEGE